MAKRAVLIGCNYPGTKAELHGCVNDVNRMYKCLVDRFGFSENDITVMVDTDKRSVQPTGANIKKVLARLIGESNPGDTLVFHYSGHGTQVPAESGDDEDDGLDEAIVPTDLNLLTGERTDWTGGGNPRSWSSRACSGKAYGARSYDAGYGRGEEREYDSRGERYGHHEKQHGHHEHSEYGKRDERYGQHEYGGYGKPEEYLPRAERYGHNEQGGYGRREGYYEPRPDGYGQNEYGGYGGRQEPSYGYQESEYRHEPRVESHRRVQQVDKSLSIETLTQMLSEQVGHDVKPGNIRTSLYDLFGEDASPTVKVFVNLITSKLQGGGSESSGGGSIWSTIGGLAMDFMKAKLNDGNSSDYIASAQGVSNVSSAVPLTGHAGAKPPPSQRLSSDVGVLVSGCQSNETSADANPTGDKSQAYGALSNGIQTILAQSQGPISNGDLVRNVRALLQKQGFKQHPCLYSSDGKVDDPFIC